MNVRACRGMVAALVLAAAAATAAAQQPPETAQTRRCHDVQRTVSGALTSYDQDNNTHAQDIPWETLHEQGYLHHVPEDPGQGPFSYMNYAISDAAPLGLTCAVHGPAPFDQENLRACLATQRLVSGAVELYNIHFNENVAAIPWDALVGADYLGRLPRDPGGPEASHVRYTLDPHSPTGIRCRRHGSAADWNLPVGGAVAPAPPPPPPPEATPPVDLFGIQRSRGDG